MMFSVTKIYLNLYLFYMLYSIINNQAVKVQIYPNLSVIYKAVFAEYINIYKINVTIYRRD